MQMAIRQRRGLVFLAMVAILAVLVILPTQASAIPQDNPSNPTACAGVWHWVHNQTAATEGTLTAIFTVGEVDVTMVTGSELDSASTNLHYNLELSVEATLKSAFDDVNDGKLLLSHWPTCPGDTAPDVSLPDDSVPEVSLPDDSGPEVSLPDDTDSDVASDVVPAGDASSEVTSTTRLEVFGTTITAAQATAQATSETLPFTGIGLEATGGFAFSLVAMGGLILLSVGYRPGTRRTYEGRHRRPARPLYRPAK